jgi:predicted nuclease of predicted toxin-antitoxin system
MAAVKFYLDEMIARPVASQLQRRGIDVLTAVDAGMVYKDDLEHLAFATEQGRVLVTFDRKFAGVTSQTSAHAGLICLTVEQQNDIGAMVRVLAEFAELMTGEDATGQVFWLN